jgi:histidinol-phosphatase (PHP family)
MIGKSPLPPDYHTHTDLCKHASGRPVDYARAAAGNGLPGLACTDHCPTNDGYDIEHRMEPGQYPRYREWVEEAQSAGPVPVLFGVEADYYPGGVAHLKSWLPRQPLDIVLGSVHYLDYWAFDNPAQRSLWETVDVKRVWQRYFGLVRELAATRLYDVAAHLDLPKKFGFRPKDRDIRECVLPALDALAAHGLALEINTSGIHKPAAEPFPSTQILSWAREREIPLTFGSDAHEPGRVGSDFELALRMAREAGYTHRAEYHRRQRSLVPLPS